MTGAGAGSAKAVALRILEDVPHQVKPASVRRCACLYVCLKLKLLGLGPHAHTCVEVCMRRRKKLC